MNIGILGGTFDPPHRGHLHLAKVAEEALGLQGVLFVPCSRQPLKESPPEASGWHRCAMLALAIQGRPTWRLSTGEVERGGVSYTAATLKSIAESDPGCRWTLLMGADSLESLPRWFQWREIPALARLAVVRREIRRAVRRPPELQGIPVSVLPARAFPARSSEIREGIRAGIDMSRLVPRPVMEYIVKQALYGAGAEPSGRASHARRVALEQGG